MAEAVDPWRFLVTGSRHCTDEHARLVCEVLDRAAVPARLAKRPIVVVHGRCPKGGVDLVAHRWAENAPDADPEPHPANWDLYGKAAGMIRNGEMVDLGADRCFGFPAPDSRGTWDCIHKAAKAGIVVEIHPLMPAEIDAPEALWA